ncbi:MAG: hypothetical protein OEV48_09755 [Acidobacteriota bacterium]|nr:hypothetical protein [Acidobacteriota bacterium]
MEEKTWGCLKQTAVGCGVLMVIAIAMPFVLGVMMMGPFKRAVDDRRIIEEQFGPQEAYVPPASGVPSDDRIEVFLGVRRAFAEPCADLTQAEKQMQKMDTFDDQDEVDRMEVMREAFSLTKSMMGVGPVLGHFYELRNQSLLDAGMGLGEFTYIFALAYNDRLLEEPEGDQLFGPTVTNRRVRRALLTMLESQLEVLQTGGGEETDIEALEAEIAAMQADDRRIPWQDGVPPAITEALAPYRAELDELYCPALAPLELMINERHGPAVESL